MKQVSREEAIANINELFEEAERGEEVVITRDGRPIAKLQAVVAQNRQAPPPNADHLIAEIRRLHAEWRQMGVKPFTAEEISELLGRRD